MSWNDDLKRHFEGRRELSLEETLEEFALSGEHAAELLQDCLSVFEQEYGVPASLLRPGDSLKLFSDPPPTKNPFRWFFTKAAFEDSASELNYRLKKRDRALGRSPSRSLMTIGDYVSEWVGSRDGRS